MAAAAFVQGLLLCLALVAALGPQNLHVLRTGLARRHVAPTVALCVAADALLVLAALGGGACAVQRLPRLADALLAAGVLTMAALAWRALREACTVQAAAGSAAAPDGLRRALGAAALVTFANPSVYIETLLLIGATGMAQPEGDRAAFGAGVLSASMLWFSGLGFGARLAAPWLARPAVWRALALASAAAMASMAWRLLGELAG